VRKSEQDYFFQLRGAWNVSSKNIPGLNLTSNEREIDDVKLGWTLGAAICEQTNCIDRKDLSCRWNKDSSCASPVFND
jgi:hypothetical protein